MARDMMAVAVAVAIALLVAAAGVPRAVDAIRPLILSGVQNAPFPTFISMSRWSWNIASGALALESTINTRELATGSLALSLHLEVLQSSPDMSWFPVGLGFCYPAQPECTALQQYFYWTTNTPTLRTFPPPLISSQTCNDFYLTTLFYNGSMATAAGEYFVVHGCTVNGVEGLYFTQYRATSNTFLPVVTSRVPLAPPTLDGEWLTWSADYTGTYVIDAILGFYLIDQLGVTRALTFNAFSIQSPLLLAITRPGLFVAIGRDRNSPQFVRLVQALMYGAQVQEVTQRAALELPFVDVQNIVVTMVADTDSPLIYGFTYNGTKNQDTPRRFVFAIDLSLPVPSFKVQEQITKGVTNLWQGIARYL